VQEVTLFQDLPNKEQDKDLGADTAIISTDDKQMVAGRDLTSIDTVPYVHDVNPYVATGLNWLSWRIRSNLNTVPRLWEENRLLVP
jgi:hypothetical protein